MDRRSFIELFLGALALPKAELAGAISGNGIVHKMRFVPKHGQVDLNFDLPLGISVEMIKRTIKMVKEEYNFVWQLTVEGDRAIIQETWSPGPVYTLASESSG